MGACYFTAMVVSRPFGTVSRMSLLLLVGSKPQLLSTPRISTRIGIALPTVEPLGIRILIVHNPGYVGSKPENRMFWVGTAAPFMKM